MSRSPSDTSAWLDAAYEALSINDIDLFLSAFAPKARWNLLGHGAGLPFAGVRVGHGAIRDMIKEIYTEFEMRDFFIEDIIVGEHGAAVRWSAMATARNTGRKSQIEVFDHIVMQKGLIVSLTQFFDTAAVADAAGRMQRVAEKSVEAN